MRKIIILILEMVNGMFLILEPYFLLGVCNHNENNTPICNFAAKAEIAIGVIVLLNALILFNNKKDFLLVQIVNNCVAILMPLVFVGRCKMATMRCNKITFPIMYLVCFVFICFYIVCFINIRRSNNEG